MQTDSGKPDSNTQASITFVGAGEIVECRYTHGYYEVFYRENELFRFGHAITGNNMHMSLCYL